MSMQRMLQKQLELQIDRMKDGDPRKLTGDARAEFIRWNMLALEDELHEALAETGWKPWGTNRDINHASFMKEMVDAWHFFMNLLLVGSGVEDPEELAAWFQQLYYTKNEVNRDRHEEGTYDGMTGKCPNCHRELSEVEQMGRVVSADTKLEYCTTRCLIAKEHN